MLKITIPAPCHEDWDKMDTNQQGRHCNSCMKTVIDFTNMSDEAVRHFLLNKKEEKLCGRFTERQLQNIQVELPSNIFQLQMPLWKRFLVACLVVFSTTLFSCEVKQNGRSIDEKGSLIKATSFLNKIETSDEMRARGYGMVGMFNIRSEDLITVEDISDPVQLNDTTPRRIGKVKCIQPDIIKPVEPTILKGEVEFIPDSIRINKKKEDSDATNCNGFS